MVCPAAFPMSGALGCETFNLVLTCTVRLPCATATVEMRTWPPMTTVPVRSFTTTSAR